MLFYSQTAGNWEVDGALIVTGCYAGRDDGKNTPGAQDIHDLGPLPQGQYTISPLHTIPHLGPSMALTPAPGNQMFGRSGFFCHLDNPAHVGASSDGCIVLPNMLKLQAIESWRAKGQDQLTVTA